MTFVWKNLIEVARELLESSSDTIEPESYYRTSINRSYYGAHKTVSDWLEIEKGFQPPIERVHQAVIDAIAHVDDKRAKRVRYKLSMLRDKRVTADYTYVPPSPIDKKEATIALAMSEDICELLFKIKT